MRENITAEWAKETATNILNQKIKTQITKCLDSIESAVKENRFNCTYYGDLDQFAIAEIKKRGFGIDQDGNWNQQDGTSYTITW